MSTPLRWPRPQVVQGTRQQASALAGQMRDLQYPKDAPAQALDHDLPELPASSGEEDPPHGKDPRYWIDATKIVHVSEGQLAPNKSRPRSVLDCSTHLRIDPAFATPPPLPAQWPLDMNDIVRVGPG